MVARATRIYQMQKNRKNLTVKTNIHRLSWNFPWSWKPGRRNVRNRKSTWSDSVDTRPAAPRAVGRHLRTVSGRAVLPSTRSTSTSRWRLSGGVGREPRWRRVSLRGSRTSHQYRHRSAPHSTVRSLTCDSTRTKYSTMSGKFFRVYLSYYINITQIRVRAVSGNIHNFWEINHVIPEALRCNIF